MGQSVCPSDPELLRAAQCDDAEIAAHMFMHSKGLCPVTQDDAREEYEHMVRVFRRGRVTNRQAQTPLPASVSAEDQPTTGTVG